MPLLSNRKKYFFIALLLFTVFPVTAQYHYLIFLKDKNNSSYTITQPQEFLSQMCIANRDKWQKKITAADLPVSTLYIDSLMALPIQFHYSIKWLNMLHISAAFDIENQLNQFSFIEKTEKIFLPDKKNKTELRNKTEKTQCTIADSLAYAHSYRQTAMLHLNSLHDKDFRGEGIRIAVMDAGFTDAPTNRMLSELFNRNGVIATWDFVENDTNVYDHSSHGLSCLGVIAADYPSLMIGSAPDAEFLLYRTEDDDSETILEEYNWAAAAEVAENQGAVIFSTSLGYTTFDSASAAFNHTPAQLNGHTTVIAKAANRAASLGVLVINAAGNSGASPWRYISTPADADSCIAVGAVKSDGTIAAFSSRGIPMQQTIKPNVCAQGELATVIDVAGNVIQSNGTSFATPIIAGAAACLWQANPEKNNIELKYAIEESSSKFTNPDLDYGYGIPNFLTAHQLLQGEINLVVNPKEETVFLYQNPVYDALKFSIYGNTTKEIQLKLHSIEGRLLFSKNICIHKDEYYYFDETISHLASGIYLLTVFEKGKKTMDYKIIKQ